MALFGARGSYVLALICYFIGTMLFFIPSSFVLSFIGALFIGYHDQLTMMNSVRVLKAFNPGEKGTSQVAIAMTGYAVGPFVWTFLIAKFVNLFFNKNLQKNVYLLLSIPHIKK